MTLSHVVGTTSRVAPGERWTSSTKGTWKARAVHEATTAPLFPLDPTWADPMPDLEDQLFLLINADRKANGLSALFRDRSLDPIARWAAEQRAWALYLDHTDHIPAGEIGNTTDHQIDRLFGGRFADLGYVSQAGMGYSFAENMAYGFQTAQSVETAFMSDIGHKDNVLGQSSVGVGIGVARSNNNCAPGLTPMPGLIWWVQDFGSRPQQPGPTPDPVPTTRIPQVDEIWTNKKTGAKVTVVALRPKVNPVRVSYRTHTGTGTSALLANFLLHFSPPS